MLGFGDVESPVQTDWKEITPKNTLTAKNLKELGLDQNQQQKEKKAKSFSESSDRTDTQIKKEPFRRDSLNSNITATLDPTPLSLSLVDPTPPTRSLVEPPPVEPPPPSPKQELFSPPPPPELPMSPNSIFAFPTFYDHPSSSSTPSLHRGLINGDDEEDDGGWATRPPRKSSSEVWVGSS